MMLKKYKTIKKKMKGVLLINDGKERRKEKGRYIKK